MAAEGTHMETGVEELHFVHLNQGGHLPRLSHIQSVSLPPKCGDDNEGRRPMVHLGHEPKTDRLRIDVIAHGQTHYLYLPKHKTAEVELELLAPEGQERGGISVDVLLENRHVSVTLFSIADRDDWKKIEFTRPIVTMSPKVVERERQIKEQCMTPKEPVWPHHGNSRPSA